MLSFWVGSLSANDRVALILGDNVFYGHGLSAELTAAASLRKDGATIFAYYVSDPTNTAWSSLTNTNDPSISSKNPDNYLSNWAVTGLYFYDNAVLDIAAGLRPSARGELEITDVNRRYLELKKAPGRKARSRLCLARTGTHDALLEAGEFVRSIQHRQGLIVGCPEEVAYIKGFISAETLHRLAAQYGNSTYGQYLRWVADSGKAATGR